MRHAATPFKPRKAPAALGNRMRGTETYTGKSSSSVAEAGRKESLNVEAEAPTPKDEEGQSRSLPPRRARDDTGRRMWKKRK